MSFKCSQCYDEYSDKNPLNFPKILKCGCTLCFKCLKFSLGKARKVCPTCTSEIKETLDEIRTNIFAYNSKNAIVCGACFKEFENDFNSEKSPKVLKCGETICFECIKKNFKNDSIFCPICTKTTEEKLDEIPVNKLVIESVQKEILNNVHFFSEDNKVITQNSFDYEFSIGLMGDISVGKTSITHYFYKGTPLKNIEVKTTVGFEFHFKLMKIKEKNIKIRLWDTAGSEAFRSYAMGLLRGVNAAVIVFSLAVHYDKDIEKEKEEEWKNADENKREEIAEKIKIETFNGVKSWYKQYLQFNDEKEKIIYLIGNKLDDVEHRAIKSKDALSLANELNLKYFETSAVTGEGINNIFSLLCYDLMDKFEKKKKLNTNTDTGTDINTNNNIHLTKESNQAQNANTEKKCCK